MPSLVVSAHEECSLPPTKYRLSKTLAGSANQVSRGGALLGSVTYAGATSIRFSPPLCGSKQVLTRVPRNSKPAAVFANRKSTRLNSSHGYISYAVFCLKKKK